MKLPQLLLGQPPLLCEATPGKIGKVPLEKEVWKCSPCPISWASIPHTFLHSNPSRPHCWLRSQETILSSNTPVYSRVPSWQKEEIQISDRGPGLMSPALEKPPIIDQSSFEGLFFSPNSTYSNQHCRLRAELRPACDAEAISWEKWIDLK